MQQIYQSATLPMEETMDLVRLVTDRDEIGSLSVELCLSAQRDVAGLETEHTTWLHRHGRRGPDPRVSRGHRAAGLLRTVVGQVGVRARHPRKPAPRQGQVLRLMLIGMTYAAIVRHPGISERTVRGYVGALLETLGASNRVTLVVAAVRDGWVVG